MRPWPRAEPGVLQVLGRAVGPFRYGGPFLFALSIPILDGVVGPLGPIITVAILLLLLVGAEWLLPGKETGAVRGEPAAFRLLPFFYVPVQLAVIVWAVVHAEHIGAVGFLALVLAVGVTTGVFGVLVAHELVHDPRSVSQWFGAAMLSGMSYRHFRIAHVFGHHRRAATEDDPASARLGESVYHFLVRSIVGQYRDAWHIESARLRATGRSLHWHRLLADAATMAGIYLAFLWLAGWQGVALFALESAIAIVILEVFNYVAHYGLLRRGEGEAREPFGASHSWNSSNTFANALIFNMGRHAQHHANATAPYQSLAHDDAVQELPFGYAASILLALIPPLWHRIMDPAAQRLQTRLGNVSAQVF